MKPANQNIRLSRISPAGIMADWYGECRTMRENMERTQNVVRLLDPKAKAKKARGSSVDETRPKTIKLAIRFLTGLNGPLRSQT